MSEPDGSAESARPTAESDQWNLQLWEKCEDKDAGQLQLSEAEIQTILDSIFAEEFAVRQQNIGKLIRLGPVLARHLVDTLVRHTTNNTLLFQITYALEVIGKPAVKPLMEAMNNIGELKDTLDVAKLENISETLIRINDKSAAPLLAQRIKLANNEIGRITQSANGSAQNNASLQKKIGFYHSVRLKLHDLLGKMKATDAIDDLLLLMGDGRKRVHEDVIETLSKVGDKRALVPLIRLYSVEMGVSELGARYIKLTCREIIRREKVAKSDSIFKELTADEKKVLDDIFPGHRLEQRTGSAKD